MTNRPIPTSKLVPVAVACVIVALAALIGVPEIILVPIATITVAWSAALVVRHYLTDQKQGDT